MVGSAVLQEVREMHAGGMPIPLAVPRADECFKGPRERVGQRVGYLQMMAVLERIDIVTATAKQ